MCIWRFKDDTAIEVVRAKLSGVYAKYEFMAWYRHATSEPLAVCCVSQDAPKSDHTFWSNSDNAKSGT